MSNQSTGCSGSIAELLSQNTGTRARSHKDVIVRGWLVWVLTLSMVAVAPLPAGGLGEAAAASPPRQPASGPGSATYPYDTIRTDRIGSMPSGSTAFSPQEITRKELRALPVVVFLHGFTAVEPQRYGGWIAHLVRRGAIVIYPDYQHAGVFAGGQDRYIANMFVGIARALDVLDLDPSRVHVVGHSLGAVLTMVYGVTAAERDLPPAASLTMIEPGGCRNCGNSVGFGVPLPLDGTVPEDTLVSIVAGEDDALVGTSDARVLSGMVSALPPAHRRFVVVRSDDHGQPSLVADHLFPQTGGRGGEEDSLDWYGLWRPLDALVSCAETGQDCDIALGTSEEALFMGTWSDGIPVATPWVEETTGPRWGSAKREGERGSPDFR